MTEVHVIVGNHWKCHSRSSEVIHSFALITRDWMVVAMFKWCQLTCLIKTRRLICHMTCLGRDMTLTWDKLNEKTKFDLSRSSNISFDSS